MEQCLERCRKAAVSPSYQPSTGDWRRTSYYRSDSFYVTACLEQRVRFRHKRMEWADMNSYLANNPAVLSAGTSLEALGQTGGIKSIPWLCSPVDTWRRGRDRASVDFRDDVCDVGPEINRRSATVSSSGSAEDAVRRALERRGTGRQIKDNWWMTLQINL